jgi:hypothetical protein
MRLAIMQPYFFPYVGYFQLMAGVDRFVVYDDVAFIKNGWVNRNRILLAGEPHYITVPVRARLGVAIRETPVDAAQANLLRKLRSRVEDAYRRTAHRDLVVGVLDEALAAGPNIGDVARASVLAVARLLGIATAIVPTSSAYGNEALHGQDRVIDVCKREGASEYRNAPGGRGLYDGASFGAHGIRLTFLEAVVPPYPQAGAHAFVPGLSILDVLANCGVEETRAMARLGAFRP